MKILIPVDVAPRGKEYLKNKGYEIVMGTNAEPETMKREIVDCDGILIRTQQLPGEVLSAGKKLKVIGRHGVGVDNIDLKTAKELGIVVTNTPHANTNAVAEQTLTLMLAISKNLCRLDNAVRNNRFEERLTTIATELQGKTAAIIGLGRIGLSVAKKAHYGFDMNVIGYDPYINSLDDLKWLEKKENLDEALTEADFVSLHMPATKENQGFMNINKFTLMKNNSYLINVSRGELINENDLVSALSQKIISGAAIDVFAHEPPAPNHPFYKLENIIMSPHSAALTDVAMSNMSLHAAMGIDDVLSNRVPKWVVNDI